MDIKVGVFCKDREKAREFILGKIGGRDNALRIIEGEKRLVVETTLCRFVWVSPVENCCGQRFNFVYIQKSWMFDDQYWPVIAPTLTPGFTPIE